MSGIGQSYTCEVCGGTFEKGWSDEEAWAEAKSLYPPEDLKEVGLTCDDCFRKVMDWVKVNAPELLL